VRTDKERAVKKPSREQNPEVSDGIDLEGGDPEPSCDPKNGKVRRSLAVGRSRSRIGDEKRGKGRNTRRLERTG